MLMIELTRTVDPSGLFAPESDMTGVDVQASMERFDALLLDRVRDVYPAATVGLTERGRIWEETGDGAVNGYDTPAAFAAGQVVQQLADDLLNQSDEWVVTLD